MQGENIEFPFSGVSFLLKFYPILLPCRMTFKKRVYHHMYINSGSTSKILKNIFLAFHLFLIFAFINLQPLSIQTIKDYYFKIQTWWWRRRFSLRVRLFGRRRCCCRCRSSCCCWRCCLLSRDHVHHRRSHGGSGFRIEKRSFRGRSWSSGSQKRLFRFGSLGWSGRSGLGHNAIDLRRFQFFLKF